jgi:predicted Zn-dependent protease
MRYYLKICIAIFLIITISCVKTPISNNSAFILIPINQEVALGKQAFKQILKNEQYSNNKVISDLIKTIGFRIAKISAMPNLDWEFKLIESKEQNAFALPGGKVAVYTGLLPIAMNEAGLATVMSHEIAHVIARHGAQRMTQQLVLSAGLLATSISLDNSRQKKMIMAALGVGIAYGFTLPFSRSNEAEADQIGLRYMAKAGYDPNEATRFWKRFSDVKGGERVPEFLSTHPADRRRIALIKKYLTRAKIDYNSLKVKYGLGKTLELVDSASHDEKNHSIPKSPKAIPNISIQTLTKMKAK